jgi:hypothetical protein
MSATRPTFLRRFATLLGGRRRSGPSVATPAQLAACLAGHARFASQKCAAEYLRLRGGLDWDASATEQVFREGIERLRRDSYVRLLGDVAELAEIVLRAADGRLERIAEVVPPAVAAALADPAQSWPGIDTEAASGAIAARLAQRRAQAPRPLRRVGAGTARHLLDLMPFDRKLQEADLDYVENNVCFTLAQVHERLRGELDTAALLARVSAAGGPGRG